MVHKEIWLFTLLFGTFLCIGQWILINMDIKNAYTEETDKISME